MGFTTPCFIRKNTQEIRRGLSNIGYEMYDDKMEGSCLLTIPKNALSGNPTCLTFSKFEVDYFIKNIFDCGTNEDLFLAIAALRDDSDIYQWFILDTSVSWASENFHPKGTFILCKRDKWNVDIDKNGNPLIFSSRNIPAHKANVKELIQHFNI